MTSPRMSVDPSSLSAQCVCGHELWDYRKGQWVLSTRVVKLNPNGSIEAKCPECRQDVPVLFLQIREPPPMPPLVVTLDSLHST